MTLRILSTIPRFAAALLAAAVAGCAVGPDYRPPALDIPAAYRATPASAATAWPATDWWRGFHSAELDQLIADAEAHNFDLLAAVARVQQADAQIRISGAGLLPSAGANASDSWTRSGRSGFGGNSLSSYGNLLGGGGNSKRYGESRDYQLNLQVNYEVDFWGRVRDLQGSAVANALYSRFDQETVALTAITSIATTWFTALAYQDRLAVARRNLKDSNDILLAIQARMAAGTASLLDVSQQQALRDGIRAQIPGLQSNYEQEVNALATLVGRPPEEIAVTAGTLTDLPLPEVAAGLPSQLLTRRPDVAAVEAQLIAANFDVREARAAMFPTISLTGQAGFQSASLLSLFGPGTLLTTAAANLAQTVFDNGFKGGTLSLRRGRYLELLADYHKAVVQAFIDVEDGLLGYRYATEQEALQRTAADTAQRAADIARAQLLAGTSDLVTALQAQSTLYSDLDILAQDRLNRFTTLINLYKAVGGGWTRADVIAPPDTIFHGVL